MENPNTILLAPTATTVIQAILEALTNVQRNPQVSEEMICGFKLIKITFAPRPDEGKIAKAMKEGK